MSHQSRSVNSNIPINELNDVINILGTAIAKLTPYLQDLSPNGRQEILKLGDKSLAFVQKALENGQLYPSLVPQHLDIAAFAACMEAVHSFRTLLQILKPIIDSMEDTSMIMGSESYQYALMLYGNIRNAAKANVPKAGTIYAELSERFPGRSGRKKDADHNEDKQANSERE